MKLNKVHSLSTLGMVLKEISRSTSIPENARFEAKEKLRWFKQLGSIQDYVTENTNLFFEVFDISAENKLFYFVNGLQQWARKEL